MFCFINHIVSGFMFESKIFCKNVISVISCIAAAAHRQKQKNVSVCLVNTGPSIFSESYIYQTI